MTRVDGGPRTVSYQTSVAAPAEELFAILANPHRHHEVDGTGTVQRKVNGPAQVALGDKFTVSMRYYNIPYQLTSTVTRLDPGRLIEWQHPARHSWRWQFEPGADGTTLVTETFDYSQAPGAPVYELVRIPALNAKGIKASLARLREMYTTPA